MSSHRLPTRVSNACDRCRRQKQRCDVFRPCSNCTNTRRECTTSDVVPKSRSGGRSTKRRRTSHHSPHHSDDDVSQSETGRRSVDSVRSEYQKSGTMEGSATNHAEPLQSPSDPRFGFPPSEIRKSHQSIMSEFGDSTSAMEITKKALHGNSHSGSIDRATFAIPGGDSQYQITQISYSVHDLIGVNLLPKETCDALIDAYFLAVHWFSLVVYEPTFRERYQIISNTQTAQQTDRPFLLLLLMVLIMGCHYGSTFVSSDLRRSINLSGIRDQYLKVVRQNFMDLLDEEYLEFIQICTLLGSYWLYWGKPKSSFILLGTAIKAAQAISLHRPSSRQLLPQVIEERKRVWWTIYTWDRFATITYGRPLGINDRDCRVQMPALFKEHVVDVPKLESVDLCLSQYQILLNRIYHIASPVLENIYGIRYSSDTELLSQMPKMVKDIETTMRRWYRELPAHMDLDQNQDLDANSSLQDKLHRLQTLSLQLTFENLIIIIHRPLLLDWTVQREQSSRRASLAEDTYQQAATAKEIYDTSFQLCLKAALKVSTIQQSKPNLIRLARRTHLLSFLGMNLFTSSVVMFICASSDVLSDSASEAKRGISRNLKVLKSLSHFGSLSSQCTGIIEDLVQLIVEREKEQMLQGSPASEVEIEEMRPTNCAQEHETDQWRYNELSNTDGSGPGPVTMYNDTAVALGETMQTLQRVLQDPSNARIPQRYESFATDTSPSQNSLGAPTWSPSWPDTSNVGHFMGDNSLMQDMGQFWLWEAGPSSGDFSHTGWDSEGY